MMNFEIINTMNNVLTIPAICCSFGTIYQASNKKTNEYVQTARGFDYGILAVGFAKMILGGMACFTFTPNEDQKKVAKRILVEGAFYSALALVLITVFDQEKSPGIVKP